MPVTVNVDPLAYLAKHGFDVAVLQHLQSLGKVKVSVTFGSPMILFTVDGELVAKIKTGHKQLVEMAKPSGSAGVKVAESLLQTAKDKVLDALNLTEASLKTKAPSFAVGDKVIWSGYHGDLFGAALSENVIYLVTSVGSGGHLTIRNDEEGVIWSVGPSALLMATPEVWPYNPSPALSLLTGTHPQPAVSDAAAPAAHPASKQEYPVYDTFVTHPLVSLRNAVGLYAPVHGTSKGSRYFLVADFGDLKMAARFKPGNLSVRFEASSLGKFSAVLNSLGFAVKKDYASLHIDASTVIDANKALGAIIYGTGMVPVSPQPSAAVIVSKGS